MNEMEEQRTPEIIGAEIRMYYEAGRRVTMLCGIEIGRRLNEAKQMLSHGEWMPWLEREVPFSDRHAQNYMKIYREYGAAQQGLFGPETNAKYISDLPISKALLLLSVPESDRDAFAEEVDAEHISAEELKQAIREKEEAQRQLQTAEARLEETQKTLAGMNEQQTELNRKLAQAREDLQEEAAQAEKNERELRARIRELENRPVEVAVERDEAAIEEAAARARAEADEAWKKQIEQAQKDLKKAEESLTKAEKERDKLKTAAEAAESGAAEKIAAAEREAESARQELETARKQLAAADRDVTEFGVHFRAVQEDLRALDECLEKIKAKTPELGEKLTGALRIVLGPYVKEEA